MAFHAYADFGSDAKGEALEENHKDWVQLLSLSHTVVQPKSSSRNIGGGTVNQAEFGDYTLRKYTDKASPKLMELASNGKHLSKVTIDILKPIGGKGTKFMVIELENVVVTSVQTDAQEGSLENYPIETVTLAYDHLQVTYTQVAQDGTSKGNTAFKWSLAKGASA